MATIFETDTNALIDKTAGELKKLIKAPDYAMYVKTGAGKERPPTDREWYYKRAASILRSIYLKKIMGVNKLKVKYATKKNKGNGRRTCLQSFWKNNQRYTTTARKG